MDLFSEMTAKLTSKLLVSNLIQPDETVKLFRLDSKRPGSYYWILAVVGPELRGRPQHKDDYLHYDSMVPVGTLPWPETEVERIFDQSN